MFFEWYKFVGSLAVITTYIMPASPAFQTIPRRHYHVLSGLMNRCSRLMLSNVALSHEGRFGETTSIVDRCIFESALKITWLCENPIEENFTRFLADGLRTELEFREEIQRNIAARDGKTLPIEVRMLKSIDNHITASELSEQEIVRARRLPDVASLMTAVGYTRLVYVVTQKIGSHHVHGTWPSLLFHYLEEETASPLAFVPRGSDCETHMNQYMYVSVMMLRTIGAYVRYVLDVEGADTIVALLTSTEEEIMQLYTEAVGGDLGN